MKHIEPIAAFDDNYIWCLFDDQSREALVVDPGDAAPVIGFLKENGLQLKAIVITHHHFDHVGGIDSLQQHFQNIDIYGPDNPTVPQIQHRLKQNERCEVIGIDFQVIEVPGHTMDHIAFFAANGLENEPTAPFVFCGDTLFAGGCGRIFEGNPVMMLNSLDKLAALPAETRIYCAHEYTLANLNFAQAVEPGNPALAQRAAEDNAKRQQAVPTVPSLLATELATNPFLRSRQASVISSAQEHSLSDVSEPAEVFTIIRGWKDNF